MLSKKTRYAMLALVVLAREYGRTAVPISRIAESEHIPQRVLEGIMMKLRNKGFLTSTRGKTGGYCLSRPPQEVSLLDIVIMLEGTVSMLACVCEDVYRPCEFCKDEVSCPIRSTFAGIYRHTTEVLRRTSLADLTADTPAQMPPEAV